MFDDINEPKWTPYEFTSMHVPLKRVKLVGDEDDRDYTVLTEVAKGLFGSLFLLIEKLKRHGFSFYDPLTVSQLRVDKFSQFVIPDGTLLQKTCRRFASHDYVTSASVFEDIISRSCGEVAASFPNSFKDLLRILIMKRTQHGYLMLVHPSLLPLHAYSQAYLDVYDHVKYSISDDKSWKILSALKRSVPQWDALMDSNSLLDAWFTHEAKDRFDVEDPKHLITYLRNVHSHLLVYQPLLGRKFTKDDIRQLVSCRFSKVLSTLYWKMWVEKVLIDIKSETYFCIPGGACCPRPGFCLRSELRLMIQPKERGQKIVTAESAVAE